MNSSKLKRLKAAGWKVGTTREFLGLQEQESALAEVRIGRELKVTVHGKVIARIVPEIDAKDAARRRLAALRAKCRVGDVMSPAGERWDAEQGRS